MKKTSIILLASILLLCFNGCTKSDNENNQVSVSGNPSETTNSDYVDLAAKWTELKMTGKYNEVISQYEKNIADYKGNSTLTNIYEYCLEKRNEESQHNEKSKKIEESRLAEESKKAEESQLAEESRKAEESRLAEESKKAEESRLAEESRKAEESRLAEESRKAEESRLAEESRKAEESTQNQINDAKNSIKITTLKVSEPNSAGGVDVFIDFYNRSNKTIKYVYYNVQAYNAVDDPVSCEITRDSTSMLKFTGPVASGAYSNNQAEYDEAINNWNNRSSDDDWLVPTELQNTFWECVWYNYSIKYCKILSVEIVFMDNSKMYISEEYIPYIM